MNEFERLVADGERKWQLEELRSSGGRRPFGETWWFPALISLQVWPRALMALEEPTGDRVWEAVIFSLLLVVFLLFWLRGRRRGAARREELRRELDAQQSAPGEGKRSTPA